MTLGKYKKFFGVIVICLAAAVTGIAVGNVFAEQNMSAAVVTGTAADYRDSEESVISLVQKAESGASVDTFNAYEVFEIAEYYLYHNEFYRLTTGQVDTNTFGIVVKQFQQTERIYKNGIFASNKFSPSSSNMAPSICSQLIVDTNKNLIKLNSNGEFETTEFPIRAKFDNEKFKNYSDDEYLKEFCCDAFTVMPYIVSSITCGQGLYSEVKKNGNDYSFEISMSGDHLAAAGLYYAKEINASAGVATFTNWSSLKMNIVVDSSFRFKSISYVEKYFMKHNSTGAKPEVVDTFEDSFYYGEDVPELEEVLNGSTY